MKQRVRVRVFKQSEARYLHSTKSVSFEGQLLGPEVRPRSSTETWLQTLFLNSCSYDAAVGRTTQLVRVC